MSPRQIIRCDILDRGFPLDYLTSKCFLAAKPALQTIKDIK